MKENAVMANVLGETTTAATQMSPESGVGGVRLSWAAKGCRVLLRTLCSSRQHVVTRTHRLKELQESRGTSCKVQVTPVAYAPLHTESRVSLHRADLCIYNLRT